MDRVFLGVDLGGTYLKGGLVAADGRVLVRRSAPTAAAEGPEAVVGRLCAFLEELAAASPAGGKAPAGVGIGAAGAIDSRRGLVRFAPNLPGFRDVPLARLVRERLGWPTVLENDAGAAAWGELWAGNGRGCSTFVLYTLGTGVGGGLVLDGRLWGGRDGAAGELGHVEIRPDGDPCPCGRRGCLEAYASAPALVRRARALPGGLPDAPPVGSAEAVFEGAARGDAACRVAVEDAADALGRSIAGVLATLNPERILIGGGVAAAGEALLAPVREAVRRHALPVFAEGVSILPALLGSDAGFIGAAGCALTRFEISASSPTSTTASPRSPTACSS
ncbi:MAG: ROK family protein [Planctomycetes bacterium]|nr:ROK family protein [Planctomycetota bacterium]